MEEITTKILQDIRDDIARLAEHTREDIARLAERIPDNLHEFVQEMRAFREKTERDITNVKRDLGVTARAILRMQDALLGVKATSDRHEDAIAELRERVERLEALDELPDPTSA